MSATRLSLNETLGNVCHMSVFIRDIWECLSHVCPYMKHLGNVCHVSVFRVDPGFRKGGVSKVMYEAQRVSWGSREGVFDVFLDKTVEMV